MKQKLARLHIGLRTIKTTIAIIIAILIVEALGTTESRLIFAMLGAMAAVQPTFKESLESCLSQVIGVVFGALCGILLPMFKMPSLITIGIGIILVITLYNVLQIRYSPSLPCFILVMLCSTPGVQPVAYAAGRIWDTAIGLAVGMAINMLVFPYDNSKKIRFTAESLDKELIYFLHDLFDGDDVYPDIKEMQATIDTLATQLRVFSNQKLILKLRRQHEELETFKACEQKARALIAQMEVLRAMGQPGKLDSENRKALNDCGADVGDENAPESFTEQDVVTNYHVRRILLLRRELLDVLQSK